MCTICIGLCIGLHAHDMHRCTGAHVHWVDVTQGATLLNQRPPAPRHVQFRTSTLNPMDASGVERGWDPRIRLWTGRRMNASDREPTSLWCASWGASAGTKSLDMNFKAMRPQDIEPQHYDKMKELHTRGWR